MNIRARYVLRLALAVVVLLFGVIVLAGGVLGPEPIRIGGSDGEYLQIVLTPPANWLAWGLLALATAAALAAPLLWRKS